MFGNKMPYSNMQQLNLDWLLSMLKKILAFMPIDKGAIGDVLQRKASGAAWEPLSSLTLDIHGLNTAEAVADDDEIAIYDKTAGGNRKATIADVISLSPVKSVNGRTGAVVLDATAVGALPTSYTPPVTSVNGQTGAVSVYSRTLLWTNPTPNTLAAGTVNVNMDGYDHIEIECTETGNIPMRTFFVKCPIGTDDTAAETALTTFFFNRDLTGINALGVMSRYARVYRRGIVFDSGDMLYDGTYYKNWDNRAVPYRIWGIKY